MDLTHCQAFQTVTGPAGASLQVVQSPRPAPGGSTSQANLNSAYLLPDVAPLLTSAFVTPRPRITLTLRAHQ